MLEDMSAPAQYSRQRRTSKASAHLPLSRTYTSTPAPCNTSIQGTTSTVRRSSTPLRSCLTTYLVSRPSPTSKAGPAAAVDSAAISSATSVCIAPQHLRIRTVPRHPYRRQSTRPCPPPSGASRPRKDFELWQSADSDTPEVTRGIV